MVVNHSSGLFGAAWGDIVKEIRDLQAQLFDTTTSMSESSEVILPFRENVAPSFGGAGLDLKALDDGLKVMIAIVTKAIGDNPKSKDNFDKMLNCFNQLPCAKKKGDLQHVVARYTHNSTNWFKLDGSPDQRIVDEVRSWWIKDAVPDYEVEKDTRIDMRHMAEIVARSGAAVTNLFRVIHAEEYKSEKVVDSSVLRYPDVDSPSFMLYRIQVRAWADCRRTLCRQTDNNGIESELTIQRYEARGPFFDHLSKETLERMTEATEKDWNQAGA